ncbi:hypothetical protein IAU59_003845 [Kwoniella sp. CBS 9459]
MHLTPSTPTMTAPLGLAPTLLNEPTTPTPLPKSRQHDSTPQQLLTPASSHNSMNDILARRPAEPFKRVSSKSSSWPTSTAVTSAITGNNGVNAHVIESHNDAMTRYFKIQDMLIEHYPRDANVPYPTICTLGGQSAGKSSVLSALLNIDLWCAEGMATHGPTRIASRRGGSSFKATISIIVTSSGGKKTEIAHFGEIYDEKDMVEAMHLAGEEARFADGGWRKIRTWAQLKAMSEQERAQYKIEGKGWSPITENVVSVVVFGPTQPQFDIYDLPGTNGDPKIKALVAKYIAQPHNIILLCLPGGSRDTSPDDPEVQLVRENDPTGTRTLAVITRADETSADPDDRSTWISYILGETNNLDITPAGGIWPVQCRSRSQRKQQISLQHVKEQERQLFKDKDWEEVQLKAGRRFGIDALAKKLEEVFAQKIQENYVEIRRILKQANQSNADWIEANPAVEDPIATVHDDVIFAFTDLLKNHLHKSNTRGNLYVLHAQFHKIVMDAVPEFVAFTEAEVEGRVWTSFFEDKGYAPEGREKVFMDTLLEYIKNNTSKRDPNEIDTREIVLKHLQRYSARWRTAALAHLDALWVQVQVMQNDVATLVCNSNKVLIRHILSILEPLAEAFMQDTRQFMMTMYKVHSSSPSDLWLGDHPLSQGLRLATTEHYTKQYSNEAGGNADFIGLASPRSPISAGPRLLDEMYTLKERERCFELQSTLAISLFGNAAEFSSVVGQFAQLQVLEYVKQVSKTLRKGMRLEEVREEVQAKVEGWLESDREKKKERKRRLDEMAKNAELERHLTLAFEEE